MLITRKSTWAATLIGGWLLLSAFSHARADRFTDDAEKLHDKYAADLEQVAKTCERLGMAEQARQTRSTLKAQDPYKLYVPILPDETGVDDLPENAPDLVEKWHSQYWKIRRTHAKEMYRLAQRAVSHRPSLACTLAIRAIHAYPDHEGLRRLFGHQKYHDKETGITRWHTAFEVNQFKNRMVWHEKFGWVREAHVEKLEGGQRRHNGRWITAEADARIHRDIRQGWIVETEHYQIRTNHSIEGAVALGEKLEQLHHIWRRMFFRYYASQAQVIALFNGRAQAQSRRPQRFRIDYFRNREDYVKALKPIMPNIGISVGVYMEGTRTAYFFAGEDPDDRTLYHEATHQLFHQSRRVANTVGRNANFWIVEGIAVYMESLHREKGYWVLGGLDDDRMYAARFRLLNDKFHIPLAELSTYGMEKMQADPRIATIYSEMAGLTNFLVYYEGGRYRDAMVAFLSAVYDGNNDPNLFADLAGVSYSELDKQYREFMEAASQAAGQ